MTMTQTNHHSLLNYEAIMRLRLKKSYDQTMQNSTPLVSAQHEHVSESLHQNLIPPSSSISLDEIIDQCLEGFGLPQFVQTLLLSLLLVFESQQTFISVYTDAEPTWHCSKTTSIACSSISDICNLSKSEWDWDGPSDKTIVSEWSLECASSVLTGLPSSCFFIGSLFGGVALATLGDSSLGRKKWRGQVAIIAFCFFSLGLISIPPMAYINRDSSWKILYVWTSIPAILCCIVIYPFAIESPRWLLMHGYEAEAVAVLKRLSSSSVNLDSLNRCLSNISPKEEVSTNVDLYSFLKDLFQRKWALRRLLTLMGLAFGIGMVYYGLLLGVGNLDFNVYLSLTFNGLLDIPAYIVTSILIERWNRRSSILTFSIISGITSGICGVIGDGQEAAQVVLELASFFSVCVAFNVLLICATELFPTCVRNSTTSMVRQAINFGAVFSPLLISAGRKNEFLSFGVFGLVVFCCGFFVLVLPETKGVALSGTFDEQESKENVIIIMRAS
ncbi:Organic cation/carnitine transporter [Melia azedarach]|uniref:Organic cation/carnitine transporter n=1 Tax=Melia azedarach TaxID=155640 RepID=A0ACC1X371_MELAZ|nr:Organic cation/carnitine transporter [Melia azedarach]